MIRRLSINNYALIDNSVVDFHDGFTVITGQTGAGKSIMLDALSLIMGMRADSKVLTDKNKKMIVEASFSSPDPALEKTFKLNDLEWDNNEIIVRREISPSGKSRGFVNDSPVNLSIMSEISGHLLDIHSQHSNSLLINSDLQLQIIDSFGNLSKNLEDYQNVFKNYLNLRNKVKTIKESIAVGKENKEFIMFRLEQLDKLKPRKGELKAIERESEILGDADRLKSELSESAALIGTGPDSALRQLQNALSLISDIDFSLFDSESSEDSLVDRLNSLKIELRDLADTLEGYSENIESNPSKYEKLQTRISEIYEAMKRFKVADEDELIELHQSLREELSMIEGNGEDIGALERNLKELAGKLKEKADKLSEQRQIAIENFARSVEDRILPLGLPNAKFSIDIQKGKLSLEGQDKITFLCSFNKNHPLQPISEVASGGEISRLMLGIKSVMAEKMNLPTIIFDEIDTGVSGEVAHKMGWMMKEMSKNIQVMSVTHLPQVAALGDTHLKVYKSDVGEKTISDIMELDTENRVKEIASMLSGTSINEAAIENARMLLRVEE